MNDEPTTDVVRDPENNRVLVRANDGTWIRVRLDSGAHGWDHVVTGPLVPMIDAERPEGVPDWAIPLIRWFWADEDGGGPYSDGEILRDLDQYPRPPAPEPTLVEPDDGESNYEPPLRYTENDMDEQAEVYFRSGWKAAMAQENPPEPTLVEQARERAAIRRVNLPGDADLLDALADELETR